MKIRPLALVCALGAALTASFAAANGNEHPYHLSAASYLGDMSDNDEVMGVRVLADGTIAVAAIIGEAQPRNRGASEPVTPILLNGATATSPGVILRVTQSGREILSVTRLAEDIRDLEIDVDDNLYVATGFGGLLVLNLVGSTAEFSAVVSAVPPVEAYRWLRNGVMLFDNDRISDVDTAHITITDLAVTDSGNYVLEATNAAGTTASAPAGLEVFDPPSDGTIMALFDFSAALPDPVGNWNVISERGLFANLIPAKAMW